MILTKEVEVKVNGKSINYYESIGYELPKRKASKSVYKRTGREFVYDIGKTFLVKIEDLPPQSEVTISAICDYCNKPYETQYSTYYGSTNGLTTKCACKNCASKKLKDVILNTYGVENVSKLENVKEKKRQTAFEHYGVYNPQQSLEVQNKRKNTNLLKYGVDNPSKNKDIRDKAEQTMMERHGVSYPSQLKEFRDKSIATWKEHFGVDHPCKSTEIKEKAAQSYYVSSSQKCSKQQLYIFDLYNKMENVEMNYPVLCYNIDICFADGIAVEYDGSGHDLSVKLGGVTKDEFVRKEIIRNSTLKKEGYKLIRIISVQDKLPSDEVLIQMLKLARQYFSDYPNHSWIEYNIDTSTVRHAEQKDGVFFDYGKLRKIK